MHDTNVESAALAYSSCWMSSKLQVPHFEFAHGHGGVIGVGSEQVPEMKQEPV